MCSGITDAILFLWKIFHTMQLCKKYLSLSLRICDYEFIKRENVAYLSYKKFQIECKMYKNTIINRQINKRWRSNRCVRHAILSGRTKTEFWFCRTMCFNLINFSIIWSFPSHKSSKLFNLLVIKWIWFWWANCSEQHTERISFFSARATMKQN